MSAFDPKRTCVELHARGLDNFSTDNPSILKSVKLLDWQTGKEIWPPPQPSLAATFAASMQFPSHARGVGSYIGPGWESDELRERFRRESEKDRNTQAAHYAELGQHEEERVNREERERFASQRRA